MRSSKLDEWLEAGVIDKATRERIEAFEGTGTRPLALWAVVGLGVLAIALGILSVVAANWDDVPGIVRLSIHFGLLLALGTTIALRTERLAQGGGWWLEAALFLFSALGLTFFGHLGQVYQTDSPLWRPLAAWLLLFAPLLLARGQSWITALMVMGGVVMTVWDYASGQFAWLAPASRGEVPHIWLAFLTTLPVLIAPFASWMRGRSNREFFWRALEQLAVAYAVGGASFASFFAGLGVTDGGQTAFLARLLSATMTFAAAGGVLALRSGRSGQATAAVLAAAAVAALLAFAIDGHDILAGLLFMALWASVAAAAIYAGWRGIFQLAVAVIAIRLIILSFELASDLLTNGFGLILAGALVLSVAWLAVSASQRFAPSRDAAEEHES